MDRKLTKVELFAVSKVRTSSELNEVSHLILGEATDKQGFDNIVDYRGTDLKANSDFNNKSKTKRVEELMLEKIDNGECFTASDIASHFPSEKEHTIRSLVSKIWRDKSSAIHPLAIRNKIVSNGRRASLYKPRLLDWQDRQEKSFKEKEILEEKEVKRAKFRDVMSFVVNEVENNRPVGAGSIQKRFGLKRSAAHQWLRQIKEEPFVKENTVLKKMGKYGSWVYWPRHISLKARSARLKKTSLGESR